MIREEAISQLISLNEEDVNIYSDAVEYAIKALEQEPILDKMRAEIEQTAKDYDKYDDYRRVRGLWIALDIIDKYRQEGI